MKTQKNDLILIIIKAEEIGLKLQFMKNNQWEIHLKKGWVLSQNETQWLLSIEGIPEMYMSDSNVLKFLEHWLKYYTKTQISSLSAC